MTTKTLTLDPLYPDQSPAIGTALWVSVDRDVSIIGVGRIAAKAAKKRYTVGRDGVFPTIEVVPNDDASLVPQSQGYALIVEAEPTPLGGITGGPWQVVVTSADTDAVNLSALEQSVPSPVPAIQISASQVVAAVTDSQTAISDSADAKASAAAAQSAAASSASAATASAALVGAPAGDAMDAHLGGDSTGLVPAVAGKVSKDAIVVLAADKGVVANGSTDDGPALAAAIAAAGVGGTVQLPKTGNVRVTTPVQITTNGLTIRAGSQWQSRIFADGCNGIEVAAGVTGLTLQGIEVACKVRHTATANTLAGIKFNGTSSSHCSNNTLRDVYIDGFQTALYGNYLWNTDFDNFSCNYGQIGIDVYGKSVNNFISGGSSVNVALIAGSRCIRLTGNDGSSSGTAVGTEGWVVADTLTYGGEVGIDLIGAAHIDIHDCIIDFNQQYGVRFTDNGTNYAGNSRVAGCYIAMTGTSGVAGISSGNAVSNGTNTRNKFEGNHLVVYSGSTCANGIHQVGAYGLMIARGNTVGNSTNGFTSADIRTTTSGNVIETNTCGSAITNNIVYISGQQNIIANNVGIVYLSGAQPGAYMTVGNTKIATGIAAPTAGTWVAGDRTLNAHPAVGSPKSWCCTVGGTPGTWVSEGNL